MAILFLNADKRAKKLLVKMLKAKNIEIPKLKLKALSAQLQEHIRSNVDLIKNITDAHVDSLTKAVIKASKKGFSPEVVESELVKQGKYGVSRAKFVTKDQLSKASAAISQERQISAGVPGYIWIVTNDSKARKSHRAHHNKYYEWDAPPIIDFSLDGDLKRSPEALHPGEDYQCRCIALASYGEEDKELLSPKIKIRTYDE